MSHLLQFGCQVMAAELETPIEANDEGAEGDDKQRLEEVAPRHTVILHEVTQKEMSVETEYQRDKKSVNKLEPEVAAKDILHAFLDGAGHLEEVFQKGVRQYAAPNTQRPYRQQMQVCHPLPLSKSKRLENSQRQHHESSADEPNFYCIPSLATGMHDDSKIRNNNELGTDLFCHSSQKDAEYPTCLWGRKKHCTFASNFIFKQNQKTKQHDYKNLHRNCSRCHGSAKIG